MGPEDRGNRPPKRLQVVPCHSCAGLAFHSAYRRSRGSGPVCIGLRARLRDLSAEDVREMHARTSNDFDKFLALGYSVSSAPMDRKGYHPVCTLGTQLKILSVGEQTQVSEEEAPAPAAEAPLAGVTATLLGAQQLLVRGAARQLAAMRREGGALASGFPSKLYRSSLRLSRSCVSTPPKVFRELRRVWRDIWK